MRIEHVVAAIVSQVFNDNTMDRDTALALHFHFDCRMSYLVERYDSFRVSASRGLHLLYHQLSPGGTYLSVFSAITDSPFVKAKEVTGWKHETTHDSCWRNIEAFNKVYFGMADEINFAMTAKGLPEVAPILMDEQNSSYMFGQFYEWLPVKVEKTAGDHYKKTITLI
jgi:hypothetical protein